MIPFDCYYTVYPKRFCLDVIASLVINIKLQSQIINFFVNRCNPFCGKASSEYHLKVTQLLRVESPNLQKIRFYFVNACFLFNFGYFLEKKTPHPFKIKECGSVQR
jgi:hypothetical protein